jgi:flavin-dependent dehydrogenase
VTDEFEVCVVGGGPAGATLAVRLAELGHHVAVVEQHRFPRPHIGESLSPAIWPLLESLGVRERVATRGSTPVVEARVRWRGPDEERMEVEGGVTVDRGTFDTILLERAREAGAGVLSPAAARRPTRSGEGWEVPLGDRVLHTRFLADATGRRRLLGGQRTQTSPRTLALHAIWCGGPPPGSQTRIDALADAWLWGAHLPGGGFRAMALVDPETLVTEGRDRELLYRRLLTASLTFADVLTSRQPTERVRACDATSYAAATPIDTSSVKVGEAAFAIDPLSSSGVQTAIQTGLAAGAAVHSILAPDGDTSAALQYYADHQRYSVGRHAATAAGLYAEHRPHADTTFWRRRSAGAPAVPMPSPRAAPLADLLPLRVRLSPAAALLDTPCLVGDRIELRRALAHPALDRPVAFLGGSELAPLLENLHAAPSLANAIGSWERSLPSGRAPEIAAWLNRRGLIEIAPV